MGAEAGSHLGGEEEEGEREDNYVTTGNDVIIQELNNAVEKLEKEKAQLRGENKQNIASECGEGVMGVEAWGVSIGM